MPPEKIYQKDKTVSGVLRLARVGYPTHTTQLSYNPEEADWGRDMRGSALISAMDMKNYIIYCTQRDSGVTEEFFMTLKKVCPPMGIRIGQPTVRTLQNDRTETYLRALGEDLGQGHQVQMVSMWSIMAVCQGLVQWKILTFSWLELIR